MSTLPRPFFHDSPAGSTLPILHAAQCATSLPSGVEIALVGTGVVGPTQGPRYA